MSRASARAESTINQLLSGRLEPSPELLHDIAPILEMPLADLLVIAGLPAGSHAAPPDSYPAAREIGSLVAAASRLAPQQVQQLVEQAKSLSRPENDDRSPVP
ncbi:hypothetical protein AMIS_5780 [Actinoplanes missouriensis 431]|uniref:HTH cro/C1-type domain-containing protein n=1 Tax=Actinoplanes missouriensis (strain ATCC 14538 / DSM 43046 / CBS 188.64 / JCM 3121 / NBRC 102363 / NCIMB 12654 / NRRL B-3342 / UNCC 431) TaxID=512565 RepID=I0GYG1_ACTM4|nr:hypothetical protein [Actinoplanes missouriensis]BAL85798.1 hypothetical protein AMIS_5780 [Actinoplanes missouriensis 431]